MGQFRFGNDDITIVDTHDIVLQRIPIEHGDHEFYKLHRRIAYHDDTTARDYSVGDGFVTDLASVPQLLTWLVPTSGRHLPAALVHDALVGRPDLDRFEADRIFRDGMGDLGVGFIRRWLMWTAVTLKTIAERGATRQKVGMYATFAVVIVLGTLATLALVTDWNWIRYAVPWIGERAWWAELLLGAAGAIVVPAALAALLWQPVWRAGVIVGVAGALLLHVMVATASVYGIYLRAEALPRGVQIALAGLIGCAATAGFVYGLATI